MIFNIIILDKTIYILDRSLTENDINESNKHINCKISGKMKLSADKNYKYSFSVVLINKDAN